MELLVEADEKFSWMKMTVEGRLQKVAKGGRRGTTAARRMLRKIRAGWSTPSCSSPSGRTSSSSGGISLHAPQDSR